MLTHVPRTEVEEQIASANLDRRFAEVDTKLEQVRTEMHQLQGSTIMWCGIGLVIVENLALAALLGPTFG
jgi:tetrahydromethanopterin S-methyltransferase subunit G